MRGYIWSIGPLHNPVTWYGINYAGTQTTQSDFQNKEKPGWTDQSSFVLEVPLRYLRPSIIYSVQCDRIVQRGYSLGWNASPSHGPSPPNHLFQFVSLLWQYRYSWFCYESAIQFNDIFTFTCSKWTFICWILAEEGTVNPLWVSIPSIHFISSVLNPWKSLNLSICRPTCSL